MLTLSAILFLLSRHLMSWNFRWHSTSKFVCTLWKTEIETFLRKAGSGKETPDPEYAKVMVLPKDDGRFDDAEEDLELKEIYHPSATIGDLAVLNLGNNTFADLASFTYSDLEQDEEVGSLIVTTRRGKALVDGADNSASSSL
ncbi:hypothetical protein RIF29_29755 [Crotalaria pallida]|uniref:Uncharacterized protein n=1 Tax=Crotalaria pallida TaxID=3830 RepID=A0AAN9HWH9_CROPI